MKFEEYEKFQKAKSALQVIFPSRHWFFIMECLDDSMSEGGANDPRFMAALKWLVSQMGVTEIGTIFPNQEKEQENDKHE